MGLSGNPSRIFFFKTESDGEDQSVELKLRLPKLKNTGNEVL